MNKSCALDEIKTDTTLPARKKFQRQSKNSTNSLSNSKRSLSTRKLNPQFSIPYIKLNLTNPEQFCKSLKLGFISTKRDPTNPKQGPKQLTVEWNPLLNQKQRKKQKQLADKVDQLLQETIMRQEELNEMTMEKQNTLLELQSLKTSLKMFQQSNAQLSKSEYQLKDSLKKMTRERNSLIKEKLNLTKKVSQLQAGMFPAQSMNLQNMKELYLEKELLELRHRFSKERTSNEKLLEEEIDDLRHKLFHSNKLLESLRINNQCLLHKNEAMSKELRSTPELMGLRSKYKKTLGERDELKKLKEMSKRQIENLLYDNNSLIRELERLRTLPLTPGEESLNFSIMSSFSDK